MAGDLVLRISGDWTSAQLQSVPRRLRRDLNGRTISRLDLDHLGRIDTTGAFVLIREAGIDAALLTAPSRPEISRLADLVGGSVTGAPAALGEPRSLYRLLIRIGRGASEGLAHVFLNFAFYGELLVTLGLVLTGRHRLRLTPLVAQMERTGLDALPIIGATNFFVGATLAFLGANLLSQFGASIFTVELVGVGVLREFAVLVSAVILAGRSASSFAAEIGAMRMNQEVDAMEVLGVNPMEALILPRFLALAAMTPLLTFAAMIAGLAGGALVIWTVLDLSPALFLGRLVANVGVRHFWIGLAKAPVMAVVVASIGCRQGLEVRDDVEQLGRHVTSAVVQALFAIIVIDALFALLFLELHL